MELYSLIFWAFVVFILASWFLDGQTKPFEKLLASIIAFLLSASNAFLSFSIALMSPVSAGFIQQAPQSQVVASQQMAILPSMIMQNNITWEVMCWIIVILAFINIINSILVLVDYTRITGVKKGGL